MGTTTSPNTHASSSETVVSTYLFAWCHNSGKFKDKFHPGTGHEGPGGEQRYSSTLSLPLELDGGGWSTPCPGRFTLWKETRYPLYRRLGGSQGQPGGVQKISPRPGFDPLAVQPVASCCTNYAIQVHIITQSQCITSRFAVKMHYRSY
jgi:hypothetical protein